MTAMLTTLHDEDEWHSLHVCSIISINVIMLQVHVSKLWQQVSVVSFLLLKVRCHFTPTTSCRIGQRSVAQPDGHLTLWKIAIWLSKIAKNLTFFSKKLTKIVIFFNKIANNFCQFIFEKMSSFWQFLTVKWQFSRESEVFLLLLLEWSARFRE